MRIFLILSNFPHNSFIHRIFAIYKQIIISWLRSSHRSARNRIQRFGGGGEEVSGSREVKNEFFIKNWDESWVKNRREIECWCWKFLSAEKIMRNRLKTMKMKKNKIFHTFFFFQFPLEKSSSSCSGRTAVECRGVSKFFSFNQHYKRASTIWKMISTMWECEKSHDFLHSSKENSIFSHFLFIERKQCAQLLLLVWLINFITIIARGPEVLQFPFHPHENIVIHPRSH